MTMKPREPGPLETVEPRESTLSRVCRHVGSATEAQSIAWGYARLIELAGKHSDHWTREDYADFKKARDLWEGVEL